ncbi:hypothetical protein L7F22_067218 [Adiantum nelumboides]|nr:hypothetical protein [Adiantum nelumboides]
MLDFLCDWAMGLGECPPKMHSRRINPLWKPAVDEPFDISTSDYYSCGRKGLHGKKFVHELGSQSLSNSLYIANDYDRDDGCDRSSSDLNTEGSELLYADADGKMYPCESPYSSQEEGILHQSIDHGKINGLSNRQPAEDKQAKLNSCCSGSDSLPHFASSIDESDSMSMGVNKMGCIVSLSTGEVDCVHDFPSVCTAGFSSDKGPSEQEMKWEFSIPPLSSSLARGGHIRTFPPPLTSVATQSYCDKLGQSPGACSASTCLRSIRCNGRFVLQEVKGPTHKYFLVSRENGRLKLELVNAENDTSAEEDEASASGACVGVDNSDSIGEMETEPACTSKVCGEDVCVESMQASMLYAKSTCVAFSPIEKLMPEEGSGQKDVKRRWTRWISLR